jgi:hypothetical protein
MIKNKSSMGSINPQKITLPQINKINSDSASSLPYMSMTAVNTRSKETVMVKE